MNAFSQKSRSRQSQLLMAFTFCALACMIAATAQTADTKFAAAKEKFAQAEAERNLANEGQSQNNFDSAQKHTAAYKKLVAEARDLYQSSGIDKSKDSAALIDYASILTTTEDFDLAEKALKQAITADPDNATAWVLLGQSQSAQGASHDAEALRSLKHATELDSAPEAAAKAYAALGGLYIEIGLYDFARESLNKAIQLAPNHSGAKVALASLDLREGELAKASNTIDSLGISPELQAFMQQALERSLTEFENSRRWMADTHENHVAYAKLLTRVGRIQDTILPLRRALDLDANDYVAWNLLGSVLKELGRNDEAKEAFGRSIEVNADQPRTRQVLQELQSTTPAPNATPPAAAPAQAPAAPSTPPAQK